MRCLALLLTLTTAAKAAPAGPVLSLRLLGTGGPRASSRAQASTLVEEPP